ncbi:hypothetical protein PROAA_170025 [Candidatus Propionivibrio aalborgensis]|uniref:Uncharacterized protein n=1 Tax=Candidatus Propionivibrio aalborgensis TaxID=1860101 RepID=A0A1A8XL90_9RHOO|nr:hypothetical protein PROAA_170025 [Candidatus Propionivibrio aalborgensis]
MVSIFGGFAECSGSNSRLSIRTAPANGANESDRRLVSLFEQADFVLAVGCLANALIIRTIKYFAEVWLISSVKNFDKSGTSFRVDNRSRGGC